MYDSLIGVTVRVSEEIEDAKKFVEFFTTAKAFSCSYIIIVCGVTLLYKQATTTMSSSVVAKSDLLHLYRRILRGCQKYPSKNRDKIFESVREDFRENMNLDPTCEYTGELEEHGTLAVYCEVFVIESRTHARFLFCWSIYGSAEKAKQQIHVAYKGLSQLHQFDNRGAASFSVSLEQNPFPKPGNYEDKRTKAVDKVLEQAEETK